MVGGITWARRAGRGSRKGGWWSPLLSCSPAAPCPGTHVLLWAETEPRPPRISPRQELPFSRHLVCCCQCLFGLGFILAVSFIFTFGGLFLLLKLTKQQAIRLYYWVKYMHVSCPGLPKMGGSRSNIIDWQIFFLTVDVVVTEAGNCLKAEKLK